MATSTASREVPDSTAVRVALWRGLHLECDPPPYVLEDDVGLLLADPAPGWQQRGDMRSRTALRARASIVAHGRLTEDLVRERAGADGQYLVLGAGLDSFAMRRTAAEARVEVFEVDHPTTQEWKLRRMQEVGLGLPPRTHYLPWDLSAGAGWVEPLRAAGLKPERPTVVGAAGLTMYLDDRSNRELLAATATLAAATTLIVTVMIPPEQLAAGERPFRNRSRSPVRTHYGREEILALVRDAGYRTAAYLAAGQLHDHYFAARRDGLSPALAEAIVVASTGAGLSGWPEERLR